MRSRFFLVLVFGIMALGAVAAYAGLAGRETGEPPRLDVPQTAIAHASGITLSAEGAAFSGTATYISLRASVSDEVTAGSGAATEVLVSRSGVSANGLQPWAAEEIRIALVGADASFPARFEPARVGGPYLVHITSLAVILSDGSTKQVTGEWEIELTPPRDVVEALRVEELATNQPVSDLGTTISIVSAARSRIETLITVDYDHGGNDQSVRALSQPTLVDADGNEHAAAVLDADASRTLVTYALPPTDFGTPLSISFGPFAVAAPDDSIVEINASSIVSRAGITGEFGESTHVEPWETETQALPESR